MIRYLITLTAALLGSTLSVAAVEDDTRVNPLHNAARYLIQSCDATGHFTYRINTNPSVHVSRKYNILRHAGTVYSLCMYEDRYPNALTRATIDRAVGYLERNAIGGVGSNTNMLAVWSRPEINGGKSDRQAKLGGTGLGLVALTSAYRLDIGEVSLTEMRRLANFLLYMQTDDGRFVSKYIPSEGGKVDFFISLYYPGEAALGLIMLYEIDPNPAWLDGARRALLYLAQERENDESLPPDHWALLATHRLLRLPRSWEHKRDDQRILAHAQQICESIIATRAHNTSYVGFTGDGRTCPSATRLEGLIAALPLLNNPVTQARTQHAIEEGIGFLLGTQLRQGIGIGGWPRAAHLLSKDHPAYSSSFNRRATEVRIDYVQHALSALLMYETTMAPH